MGRSGMEHRCFSTIDNLVPATTEMSLKVPIFRRWGKKFFVAVDDSFFNALPRMRIITNTHNAEVS